MNARILLVDDHPIVLSGLRRDLECHPGLQIVGEAADAESALQSVRQLKPDLVMMDVHLGTVSGIDLSRQILGEFPFIRIVIFSGEADQSVVDEALKIGVMGYLLKDCRSEEVLRAIQLAIVGKLYLCPEVANPVFDGYKKILASKVTEKPLLTERETDVLRLIAEGFQNKEIADKLGISTKAAEKTRSRIMAKLGYNSVAELARYAVRMGIVPD